MNNAQRLFIDKWERQRRYNRLLVKILLTSISFYMVTLLVIFYDIQ